MAVLPGLEYVAVVSRRACGSCATQAVPAATQDSGHICCVVSSHVRDLYNLIRLPTWQQSHMQRQWSAGSKHAP